MGEGGDTLMYLELYKQAASQWIKPVISMLITSKKKKLYKCMF